MSGLFKDLETYLSKRPMDAKAQRLLKRVRESGWQPIETAPRDGAEIIVWGTIPKDRYPKGEAPEDRSFIATVHWESEEDAWDEQSGWFCSAVDKIVPPTHWMPLPTPPMEDNDE